MPFEKKFANMALDSHIEKQHIPPARAYTNSAAPSVTDFRGRYPYTMEAMFPKPPQLFRGKGVTDDPASETYWKAANGIRLSGMPSFKMKLPDTPLWQVGELLAHANDIPEAVKTALVPDSPAVTSAPARPTNSP
jgi:thiosulfate dehydrogenase